MVGARDVRVARLMAEVEQERQLRLKAEQRASRLKSANQGLQSTLLSMSLAGCGKTPCPKRHRFDSVLAYCRDVANDAWQGS
jgi:hypothetical protein